MKNHGFNEIPRLSEKQLLDLIEVDEGRTDLAREVFDLCRAQSERTLKSIKAALAKKDFEAILREIHTFKTACHNMGARRSSVICHKIQDLLSTEPSSIEEVESLIATLIIEVKFGLQEVDAFLLKQDQSSKNAA